MPDVPTPTSEVCRRGPIPAWTFSLTPGRGLQRSAHRYPSPPAAPSPLQFFEAIRLALAQIRVQKLKSFFTLLGVTISVMFLIAVVSIVQGMTVYVEQDFAGKFLGVNTFNLRRFPDINTDETEETWRMWLRRPKITIADGYAVKEA